jgi:gliding motility-associated-like protein
MIQFENGSTTALQSSNTFVNIPGGFHELIEQRWLRTGKRSFAVLQAAAFFTPNGDGANDYWNLKGLNGSIYKNAKIFIFDRYGKLLKQLNPYGVGWDGNYNGNSPPRTMITGIQYNLKTVEKQRPF